MPIAMIFDTGDTVEQNDRIMQKLRERGVTLPAPGQLVHLAGPYNGGWRVIDVWESQEHADRFFHEHLSSIFAEIGGPSEPPSPRIFPVHDLYT